MVRALRPHLPASKPPRLSLFRCDPGSARRRPFRPVTAELRRRPDPARWCLRHLENWPEMPQRPQLCGTCLDPDGVELRLREIQIRAAVLDLALSVDKHPRL